MRFSAKTQAAMQILATLAQHGLNQSLRGDEVATLCSMNQQKALNILKDCQQWGLVRQIHEAYELAYHPQDITFLCIASMTEKRDEKCFCDGKSEDDCQDAAHCHTRRIRGIAQIALDDALESISLYDLMNMK